MLSWPYSNSGLRVQGLPSSREFCPIQDRGRKLLAVLPHSFFLISEGCFGSVCSLFPSDLRVVSEGC